MREGRRATGANRTKPDSRDPHDTSVRFRVLGPVEIENGVGVLAPTRRKERCLLAVLLLDCGRVVPVDRLCDLLWDGDPPVQARQAVRSQIAHLRALLRRVGADRDVELVSDGEGYMLDLAPGTVDAHRFRALVEQAGRTTDLSGRDRLLSDALDLWRGPALHNAASDRQRQRLCADLDELRLHAVEELLAARLALGRDRDLIPELARLSVDHPVRERLVEMHVLALYRQGRVTEALEVYHRARSRLAEELGLDPGPALRELHQAVLHGVPLLAQEPPGIRSPAGARFTPALLPADLPGFVGRVEHLDQLDALLAGPATTIVVSAIAGGAGVGKTALAVHWAHRVRDRFPDGQLYANLHGFDPRGAPTESAEVVRRFLDALQVPAYRIPAGLDAQVDLYRSVLADRRIMILLDNARDADQIRPLLPGSPGCLTLITSRNRLTGLLAVDGAHALAVDVVTVDEARQLLAARLGVDRVAAEPDAIEDLIARCARLPLALAIAAAQAAARPDIPLAELVAELDNAGTSLDALTGDDTATDLRAVFSCSYRALTPGAARLFRLLALHPRPDIGKPAVASLAGVPVDHVEVLLAELMRGHLLTEEVSGRYGLHDLLRSYAIEQVSARETAADREAARRRILDHYLYTAHSAALLLRPHGDPIVLAPPQSGVTCERLTGDEEALAWFTIERSVLVAAVQDAADAGFDVHAWQLAWTLGDFLDRQGHWYDREITDTVALRSACRLADRSGQAYSHRRLALAYVGLRRYDDAEIDAGRALDLYTELADLAGLARTHHSLSWVFAQQDRPDQALRQALKALDLYRAVDDRTGQATALNNIGWDHVLLGDHQQALTACQQALALFQELADRHGQALTWDSIGYAHHHLGNHQQAISSYQHARVLFQDLGDRYNEAATLTNLGDTYHVAGNLDAARQAWQDAQSLMDCFDKPEATRAPVGTAG
jgi:DNA-binding SARP family transcriptional activator/tetratricopeptide (TPR) repeat protein